MWLFEKRGFISVVAYDPKKDRNTKSEFRNIAKQSGTHLLVRARIKEDLDWLKAVCPSLVVETDSAADYSYRAVLTRKQFKKALAKSVDEIDYDSHFKEVARDNSPKVEGRYSAMMSVWSAFAKLQPISPWSGYSSYGWGGGGSYSSGKSSTGSMSTPSKSIPVKAPGEKTVEDFIKAYVESGGEVSYRSGGGPRTGFQKDDRVVGYSGCGTVVEVEPPKYDGGSESVKVKMDDGGRIATFFSNYLMPEDLPDPDIIDAEIVDEEGFTADWMYDTLRKLIEDSDTAGLEDFPSDLLALLDDDAFELLTRTQEAVTRGQEFTKDLVNDFYDEILWENSSDEERVKLFGDAECVPRKYEQEAINLFNSLEVSSQGS